MEMIQLELWASFLSGILLVNGLAIHCEKQHQKDWMREHIHTPDEKGRRCLSNVGFLLPYQAMILIPIYGLFLPSVQVLRLAGKG